MGGDMPSDEPKDGGPAFPCQWLDFQPQTGQQVVREQFLGMTLRDYFAAKALPPIMETVATLTPAEISAWATQEETIAKLAYFFADAMLRERMKI